MTGIYGSVGGNTTGLHTKAKAMELATGAVDQMRRGVALQSAG
jgi:hypothetical protein